jgi:hypothetical protein
MRGLFEFEVDGVKRGFYFNFNALGLLEEMVDQPIDQIINQLNSVKKPRLKLLSNFFYAGAINYCDFKGIEKDFTIHTVGDWIGQIGLAKASELLRDAISTKTPKNSEPLQAEGIKVSGE